MQIDRSGADRASRPDAGILALPLRASSGPMTRMDARILLTSSNCASVERMSFVVTARTFFFQFFDFGSQRGQDFFHKADIPQFGNIADDTGLFC